MKHLLLLVCISLISCGTYVNTDYDRNTDFRELKTYNFYPDLETGLSQIDNERIMRISDSIMQSKGFLKSEDPQILINFFAEESVTGSRNTLGIGLGSGGNNGGVVVNAGLPIGGPVIRQQLTVDIVDAKNDELIWQAFIDGDYKERSGPIQKMDYYRKNLSRVLKKYPPKK